ncbi:MAG: RNA polymerase factor sigma-54 [Janthinobacterium lividum]
MNTKLSQRQVLTPGLVQMVGVLALNNLELRDMINNELVENPVLEEIEDAQETLNERTGREGDLERSVQDVAAAEERTAADPFEEVDFGSYFQDYLDPGYRTASTFEEYDSPSFEQFLTNPSTLSDHLLWQLGALSLSAALRGALELLIGNLNEDGYLTASEDELLALGSGNLWQSEHEGRECLGAALRMLHDLDPVGIGARDLRECLLLQIGSLRAASGEDRTDETTAVTWDVAEAIIRDHLTLLQRRDLRELARVCRKTVEAVTVAGEAIRRLDPRPGQRFNPTTTRLIEPDVAFVKRGDEFAIVMNDGDVPSLRLNQGYRRMMRQTGVEREVRDYVKERYKSAIQLLRNLEQRKNTILRTCEVIVRRQQEFLESGVEGLRPMMIKEVAEEIGVHPSTVSRAVANKYVHTQQGVYELRFFFSEGVNGPEGSDLPLLLLKRKVKKLIEDEDARKPFTDDALTAELQRQGIQVTRRTVAKYREEMGIPSTHQRRRR